MSNVEYLEQKQTKIKRVVNVSYGYRPKIEAFGKSTEPIQKKLSKINKNKERKNLDYGYPSAKNRPIVSDYT